MVGSTNRGEQNANSNTPAGPNENPQGFQQFVNCNFFEFGSLYGERGDVTEDNPSSSSTGASILPGNSASLSGGNSVGLLRGNSGLRITVSSPSCSCMGYDSHLLAGESRLTSCVPTKEEHIPVEQSDLQLVSISALLGYQNMSHEELRFKNYQPSVDKGSTSTATVCPSMVIPNNTPRTSSGVSTGLGPSGSFSPTTQSFSFSECKPQSSNATSPGMQRYDLITICITPSSNASLLGMQSRYEISVDCLISQLQHGKISLSISKDTTAKPVSFSVGQTRISFENWKPKSDAQKIQCHEEKVSGISEEATFFMQRQNPGYWAVNLTEKGGAPEMKASTSTSLEEERLDDIKGNQTDETPKEDDAGISTSSGFRPSEKMLNVNFGIGDYEPVEGPVLELKGIANRFTSFGKLEMVANPLDLEPGLNMRKSKQT